MMAVGAASFAICAATQVGMPGPAKMAWLARQPVLRPIRTFSADRMVRTVAGPPGETYLMWVLAALVALPVLYVLFGGGTDT